MSRVLAAFGLCFLFTLSPSFAADLPLIIEKTLPIHHKKIKPHIKRPAIMPQSVVSIPVVTSVPDPKELASIDKTQTPAAPVSPIAISNLTWVLGSMTANADGEKREGSISETANIVVDRPGIDFGPEMVIELEGHVVKTIQSTVRLDVHIGNIKKSIVWNADEIKSGIFKITLIEQVTAGVMPALIPVSAIAFVTQAGEGHAAMVSLEKIVLRYSGPQVASTK
jgi:hypothetical protein